MIKKILFFTLALFFALAACGPSPEESATMTASAWTATPTITPSPTPTPIPYDMTVRVTDADGNPIAGANVTVGDGDPILTDANGATSWINLDPRGLSQRFCPRIFRLGADLQPESRTQ